MTKNIERIYKDVDFLTSINPPRNYQNLNSLAHVCTYIEHEFTKCGLTIEKQTWRVEGNLYTNIIASYNTHKTKRLIVGAHYDVCGNQPGADDNASAVAGLLETARLVASFKPEIDYRIDFVSYCLEEPPFFATTEMGSYIHAKSLYDKQVDVIGMICYEMIGYFSDTPNSQPFPNEALAKLYPHTANFIMVVGIDAHVNFTQKIYNLMFQQKLIDVQTISFPNSSGLSGLSDHRNYWNFGYSAVMINDTSFIRNPNYHEVSDTIETLDFPKMVAVINSVYHAIINLNS